MYKRQVFALSRSVHRVRERVLQFLRFQEITGGILYGEIAPDADVLAFVMPHFADRFPLENFVILDERRAAAGIHPAGKAWFLTKLSKRELDTLQQAGQQKDENEQEIEVLFQSFCRSLSIPVSYTHLDVYKRQGGGHPKLVSGKRDSGLQRDFGERNYCAGR